MAKKKTESSKASPSAAAKKQSPAKQSTTTKPAKPSAPSGMPMIDTDLAAQAAAAMLLHRNKGGADSESKGSLIEQLKADLNKPAAATVSNILNKSTPEGAKKPSPLPFGRKQVGHNQTFGGDLTRSGVPRRTSG